MLIGLNTRDYTKYGRPKKAKQILKNMLFENENLKLLDFYAFTYSYKNVFR